MPPDRADAIEERLKQRLDKLILSSNTTSAKFIAQELECIYNDRIKQLDQASRDPTVLERRADLILRFGDVQRLMRDYDGALRYYAEALVLSTQTRTSVKVHLSIGETHKERGKWAEARSAFESGRLIARRIGWRDGEADCVRGIGYILWRYGDFKKSLEAYEDALILQKAAPEDMLKARTYMEMANVYSEMHEYLRAKVLYEKALAIVDKSGDRAQQIRIFNNVGYLLTKLDDWDGAKRMYEKEIRMAKLIGDRKWEGWGYFNISECFSKTGEPQKALEYSDMSRRALEEAGDGIGIMKTYISYGYAYGAMGDLAKVRENFDKAIRMAEKNNMGSIVAYYNLEYAHTLAKVDKKLALAQAKKALRLYAKLQAPRYMEECDALIASLSN